MITLMTTASFQLMMTYIFSDGNDTDYYGEYWGSFSYTVTDEDLYDGSFKFGIGIADYGDDVDIPK